VSGVEELEELLKFRFAELDRMLNKAESDRLSELYGGPFDDPPH
jgi:hypothetical protein